VLFRPKLLRMVIAASRRVIHQRSGTLMRRLWWNTEQNIRKRHLQNSSKMCGSQIESIVSQQSYKLSQNMSFAIRARSAVKRILSFAFIMACLACCTALAQIGKDWSGQMGPNIEVVPVSCYFTISVTREGDRRG
jgi:hypothetical protein